MYNKASILRIARQLRNVKSLSLFENLVERLVDEVTEVEKAPVENPAQKQVGMHIERAWVLGAKGWEEKVWVSGQAEVFDKFLVSGEAKVFGD